MHVAVLQERGFEHVGPCSSVRTSLVPEAWMRVERGNAVTRTENVRMSKEQFRRKTERIQKRKGW